MRAAFKFNKGGAARYIAHLDLMRAMNRAIRRAGIPAAYSQGFHPHIVMSFAQALGLGYLSEGEYMEIALPDGYPLPEAMDSLNRALPCGLCLTGAWQVPEEFPTLMASVSAARWQVELAAEEDETAAQQFLSLLSRETIEVAKEGKNGQTIVDIRKGIYSIEPAGGRIGLFLAAGSALNIRPELVVKAALGIEAKPCPMTRTELYSFDNGRHSPLYRFFINGEPDERGKNDPC